MTDQAIPPIRRPLMNKKKTHSSKDGSKKKTHSTKDGGKKKKRTPEQEEKLKGRILERVAREEKAYRIVERFLDNPISTALLKRALSFINQDVYNDIVEERSILRLCGYPVCLGVLPANPRKQTYAIDRRRNKVFKLEERIKFCSDRCFTLSRVLRDSLSPEPVWLMPRNCHRGIVVVGVRQEEPAEREEPLPSNQKIDDRHLRQEEEEEVEVVRGEERVGVSAVRDVECLLRRQFEGLGLSDEDDEEQGAVAGRQPALSSLGRMRHALTQWRTEESVSFLSTPSPTTAAPALDSDDDEDADDDVLLDDDLRFSAPRPPAARARVPEYSELSGGGVEVHETTGDQPETTGVVSLPCVDSVDQVRLRRSLVSGRLQRAVEVLLRGCRHGYPDVSETLIRFVSLLRVGRSNCMFPEREWLVLGAVILVTLFPVLDCLRSEFPGEGEFRETLRREVGSVVEGKEFDELCDILC